MKKFIPILILIVFISQLSGCKRNTNKKTTKTSYNDIDTINKGDSTIYGNLIEGGINSIMLVNDRGDTIECINNPEDTTEVIKGGKIYGDKFAVIATNEYGELILQKAINLTSLLGNWKSIDKDIEIKEGGEVNSNIKTSKPWTTWKIYNGKLVFSKDTFNIIQLDAESLSLENDNGIYDFKRNQ